MSNLGRQTSTITFGMVVSTTWLEFKDMVQDPWSEDSRFLLHVTDGRMRVWRNKIQPIPQGTSSQLTVTEEAQ